MSVPNAALRYAPEFQVRINDQAVPAALRASITSVNYQTGLEGADRVELSVFNENLRWLDHPLLRLDNELKIAMGYAPDPLAADVRRRNRRARSHVSCKRHADDLRVGAGQAISHAARQQGSVVRDPGTSALATFRFRTSPSRRMVSGENGFIPILDPIGAALSVLIGGVETAAAFGDPDARQRMIRRQSSESDYDFLRRISAENGWEMVVDHQGPLGGRRLHFLSLLDAMEPQVTLRYGQSLVDFTPRVSNVGQVARVAVSFWVRGPEHGIHRGRRLGLGSERTHARHRSRHGPSRPFGRERRQQGSGDDPQRAAQ